MIGYLLEQALGNRLARAAQVATLLTQVVVDAGRPGLRRRRPSRSARSTTQAEARGSAAERGWTVGAPTATSWRRVVPSPEPRGDRRARRRSACCVDAGVHRDLRRRRRHPGRRRRPTAGCAASRRSSTRTCRPRCWRARLGADAAAAAHRRRRRSTSTGARPTRAPIRDADARRAARDAASPPARWARRSRPPAASPSDRARRGDRIARGNR